MTRYKKLLYKHFFLSSAVAIGTVTLFAAAVAFFAAMALAIVACIEIAVIIGFNLAPELIVFDTAKWIAIAVIGYSVLQTSIAAITGVAKSKDISREIVDKENQEIMDALRGDTAKRCSCGGTTETI